MVKQVLINQIFVSIPFSLIARKLFLIRGFQIGKLPSCQRFLYELLICGICEEILFYYFHLLLHHPKLYKLIHKRHHQWTSPIAIATLYCHPIEHILCNYLPPLIGNIN